jgi:transglutaminase-like putative cysteine protease
MNYRIVHRTLYEYAAPVTVSHHVARLEPRATAAQQREEFTLKILPNPTVRKVREDYFGNHLCFFSIQETHQRLEITTTSRVTVNARELPAPEATPAWEEVVNLFCDPVSPEVIEPYQFVFDSPQVRASVELFDYARESFGKNTPLLVGAADLTRRILEKRRGVCQDFAHLGIACLRSLGLPARYVSGYLRTRPPEGQPRRIGADAGHAWFRIFCPGTGWVDFDPTNNVQPGEEHIIVAYGRDFSDVSPVAGILTGGGKHDVQVSVDVEPLN